MPPIFRQFARFVRRGAAGYSLYNAHDFETMRPHGKAMSVILAQPFDAAKFLNDYAQNTEMIEKSQLPIYVLFAKNRQKGLIHVPRMPDPVNLRCRDRRKFLPDTVAGFIGYAQAPSSVAHELTQHFRQKFSA